MTTAKRIALVQATIIAVVALLLFYCIHSPRERGGGDELSNVKYSIDLSRVQVDLEKSAFKQLYGDAEIMVSHRWIRCYDFDSSLDVFRAVNKQSDDEFPRKASSNERLMGGCWCIAGVCRGRFFITDDFVATNATVTNSCLSLKFRHMINRNLDLDLAGASMYFSVQLDKPVRGLRLCFESFIKTHNIETPVRGSLKSEYMFDLQQPND